MTMEVEGSFFTDSGRRWLQTHTVYVRKYLAAGLLQNCLQDTRKKNEWIKNKMEMRLLLSIKCSGIYYESMVKGTFHPKSRFGMVLFVLISIENTLKAGFLFFLRKNLFFSQLKLCFFCSHEVFSSPSHALTQ